MPADFAQQTSSWRGIRPIDARCVRAALEVRREHIHGWRSSVQALTRMRGELSELTQSNVLGKAATVDDVYNAQVGSAVLGLADYIFEATSRGELELPGDGPADVVERIAHRGRHPADRIGYQVFASKYTHFFVDPDRYPVYDKYAARALLYHWGSYESTVMDGAHRYRDFCHVLGRVVAVSDVGAFSLADLDAYLWLVGVYREWLRRGSAAEINREVKDFFVASVDGDVHALLVAMTPAGSLQADLPHDRESR